MNSEIKIMVIAMNHGLYAAPEPGADECFCLQKQFIRESAPPDPETIDAHVAFMESMKALAAEDFELNSLPDE